MGYSGLLKYNKRGGTRFVGVGPRTKRNTEAVAVYQAAPTPLIQGGHHVAALRRRRREYRGGSGKPEVAEARGWSG